MSQDIREIKELELWHYCPNCSRWRKAGHFQEKHKKPVRYELCDDCAERISKMTILLSSTGAG